MSVRHLGALVGATLVGSIVVACAGTEPTSPRFAKSAAALDVSSLGCSPDVAPPTITYLTASPSVLSPADRQMVTVNVSYGAVDNCGALACSISSVTSNEKAKGGAPDIQMLPGGTALNLRAEKRNVYTITVTCQDPAGNTTSASTTVTVAGKSSKCAKDDHGRGDDKNGDVDTDNKCKNAQDQSAEA